MKNKKAAPKLFLATCVAIGVLQIIGPRVSLQRTRVLGMYVRLG